MSQFIRRSESFEDCSVLDGSLINPIHVLFYTDADCWAGAERVLEVLFSTLPDRVQVSIFGVNEDVCQRLSDACRPQTAFVRVFKPSRSKVDPGLVVSLWRAIRSLNPDVVHVNLSWPFASIEALLALQLIPNARVLVHEHMPLHMKSIFHSFAKRMLSSGVREHVVVEDKVASLLASESGLARRRMRVIRNGIDVDPPVVRIRDRVDKRLTILGIGRFTPQKGFDVLIEAVAGLKGVSLLLIGARTEDEEVEVRRLATSSRMADRLQVRGWTSEPQQWMRAADVLVISSRFEAGPLTLLEALAVGLPVVSTAVGYAPELLARLDDRLLVPVDDVGGLREAISFVLADLERARRLAIKGKEIVEAEFSGTAMTKQFLAVYLSMIK